MTTAPPDLATPAAVVGANVRAGMARRELSQTALAGHLNLSQTAISTRLRGVTPFDVNELAAVARILRVPAVELLDGVNVNTSSP